MFDKLKNIDNFTKNIILVFIGTSLINFINLLYQLFIAHSISPQDFASFNTLIAIFMIVSTPVATLQIALAKYSAEFNSQNQPDKIRSLFSFFLKVTLAVAVVTFFVFYFSSSYMMDKLKIPFVSSGYILAFLLASAWLAPVFTGIIQGLELFSWLVLIPLLAGALKLILTYVFLALGWNIFGALAAFLISSVITIILFLFVLRKLFSFKRIDAGVDFNKIFVYLLPVAVNSFCFIMLVSSDMVLVKLFFSSEEAGFYSLAQMLGKIFLFLPAAISIVLLPRASSLHASNSDTRPALKKSIAYTLALCAIAVGGYNLFPALVLKVLSGKALAESILLGRFFSVSMTFFMLVSVLTTYFLSIEDLRFIKYLLFFTLLQFLAIILLHTSLIQVQLVMCINAVLLFFIHLYLAIFKKTTFLPAADRRR